MPLTKQAYQVPFGAGLNQKADTRALQAPALRIAKDIEFDETGGIQTRYPYALFSNNILGGGTIANPRRIVENGDELLLFTDVALYSWSSRDVAWVLRGTHLAVAVDEQTRFASADDRTDCDRAELLDVVFYAWSDTNVATPHVHLAALDKNTGATILPPTLVDPGVSGNRPRLCALQTKVLLTWISGSIGLAVLALDPGNVAGSLVSPTAVGTTGTIAPYDITPMFGVDSAMIATTLPVTTSYKLATVTSALAITAVTKARTADGPIAIAADPTGVFLQVVRSSGSSILGDRIDTAMADTGANSIAVGTAAGTVNHITCAYRSITDGPYYRAYCFWSSGESATASDDWKSKFNWVDTFGAHGTQADFVRLLAIASRAFNYNGRVYVWGVFAGATTTAAAGYVEALENTYFLYRDDATQVSKACPGTAGGLSATSMLPNVSVVSGGTFAWCGMIRRRVPIGTNVTNFGYAERAPRDITFTFDSDEARRCARLGETLYIGGGQVLQYDGAQIVEVGFDIYPWRITATSAGSGLVTLGPHAYKATLQWPNARGEIDRSTTATVSTLTVGGGGGVDIVVNPLYTTRKLTQPPALEVWRTTVNPTIDSPFYLVTSADPAVISGSNDYIPNDPTVFPLPTLHDELSDAQLSVLQNNPENGTIIESLAPPGATVLAVSQDRLFLAGIPGSPNQVWYSKQRAEGEVAAFNDGLTVTLPARGGAITAIDFLNETLIVFKESAVYALPGDGFDNSGGGTNFGPARLLSADVGALNAEAVALLDKGIAFKSAKGWHLLNRGWSVEELGLQVSSYDAEIPLATTVVKNRQQLRCLSAERLLVLDFTEGVGQWAEWAIADGLGATLWQGTYVYLSTGGAKAEQATHALTDYGFDVETAWLKPGDLQGFVRVYRILLLGEYRSLCNVRMRVARNYDDANYFDDVTWTATPTVVGGPLQFVHGPSIQQCEAIKVRITVSPMQPSESGGLIPGTGESLKLTGLALELGFKGLVRQLPAAQKQ